MHPTNQITMLALLLLAGPVSAIMGESLPSICLSQPLVAVAAGAPFTAMIDNPLGNACEAVVKFADPSFLPVFWTFEGTTCPLYEVAKFSIPTESPNGDAYVYWRCAGQSASFCSHAIVSGGANDSLSIVNARNGTVGCVQQITSTMTSLVTVSDGTSTGISTATTLTPILTTSFIAGSTPTSATLASSVDTPVDAKSLVPEVAQTAPSTMDSVRSALNLSALIEPTSSAVGSASAAGVQTVTVYATVTQPCSAPLRG